jgi:DNA-binding transcriptional regulator YiaG
LQQIRELARLSRRELACQVAVSPASVSRWEDGSQVPRGDAAERVALLLRDLEAMVVPAA